MDVTVGTFNLNNLFDRFNFAADLGALPDRDRMVQTQYQWVFVGQGDHPDAPPPQLDELASSTPVVRIQRNANGTLLTGKPEKALRALAERIGRLDAHVLAIQEVENIDALRRFNRDVLDDPYPYEVLIEGNDPRFIDVGLLSRLPVTNVTSHRFEVHPDDVQPIFGRDLLEVDVLDPRRRRRLVKVYVNHLKSKFVPFGVRDRDDAQRRNDLRRRRQAETVARVVAARTRPRTRYVVLGDFNDAPDAAPLEPMVTGLGLVDALVDVGETQEPPTSSNPEDVPPTVRWTHRFRQSNAPDHYELLDQIWVSPSLQDHVADALIDRRSHWTAEATGVGSDHDPVTVRLRGL